MSDFQKKNIAAANEAYNTLGNLINGKTDCKPLRICLVTPDLLGYIKNGGIGTACTNLAIALAEAGHDVHVLYSNTSINGKVPQSSIDYSNYGINVDWAFAEKKLEEMPIFPDHRPIISSRMVYDWLKSRMDFDLVIFMDWQGHGFYSLHAKRCGLNFQKTAMCVILHSPSLWHAVNNAEFPTTKKEAMTWHMERKSIEMADAVISPSSYMLDWCLSHGFQLPDRIYVQPNILQLAKKKSQPHPINEIVFFGRMEYRKGLEQFCKALDKLAEKAPLSFKVTFLGKSAWVGDEHSLLYIGRHAKKWHKEPDLKITEDHEGALEYLLQPGRLAVMPSIADNSPYTVYECLLAHIPFLARDSGGVKELLDSGDREKALFGDTPSELAEKIYQAINKKPEVAKLAFDSAANIKAWQNGLCELVELIRSESITPFISVCLVHYNRPHLLKQAVTSLLAQGNNNFEVLLADDGSPGEECQKYLDELEPVFAEKGWKIFRLENGYVGKARNFLARQAKGEWLLFFDDDNIARPDMISKCLKAAQARKDGLVSLMFDVFEGESLPDHENKKENFCPLGDILAYSALENTISDATCLIHKKTFFRCGGFTEDYGLGHEDFELFLRAILAGEKFGVLPEPVFWYRRQPDSSSMLQSTNEYANRMRSLRPFLDRFPAAEAELAVLACSMNVQKNAGDAGQRHMHNDGRDPQSTETLSDIAAMLSRENMSYMAKQVYQSIYENNSQLSEKSSLLLAEALEAARSGNRQKFHRSLEKFQRLNAEESENLLFFIKLFGQLPAKSYEIRRDVINILDKLQIEDVYLLLDMAEQCAELNMEDKGIKYLLQAWQVSDKNYLKKRPDVAQAIEQKLLVCPMQHFVNFGINEGMSWPFVSRMAHLIRVYKSKIERFVEMLSKYYSCQPGQMSNIIASLLNVDAESANYDKK